MGRLALTKKIGALPPHLQKEVLDYAEFLIQKYASRKRKGKFKFKCPFFMNVPSAPTHPSLSIPST